MKFHTYAVVALVAGILVLLMPRLLNYVVALCLIGYGLHELNRINNWAPGLIFVTPG